MCHHFWVHCGYCQAQSQLQVKLSLKTELALISNNPAPTHPHPPGKVIFQHFSVYVRQVSLHELGNNLNGKEKMTSIFGQMEDDLTFGGNGR